MDLDIRPKPIFEINLQDNNNLFKKKFGDLPDSSWFGLIANSQSGEKIDGIQFPYPANEQVQSAIHGNTDSVALREAQDFYIYV